MSSIIRQATSSAVAGPKLARTFGASAVTLKAVKKRDPSLPTPPKGAASGYGLFVKEWFPANKDDTIKDGKFDLKTASAAMSNAWAALTADNKQPYMEKAKAAKKAFDAEYKTWYSDLDAATIKAIEASTGKKLAHPGGKKGKTQAENERPGNPGRPLTAFFEYLLEFRQGEGKGMAATEMAKQAGEQWRSMSDADKQKYRDTAADKKSKYLEWQKTLQ